MNNKKEKLLTRVKKTNPTNALLLLNMFDIKSIGKDDKTYFPELEHEVKQEMKRYGHVKNFYVDQKSK